MKRIISNVIVSLMFLMMTSGLFAKESVLIDFNKLRANGDGNDPAQSLTLDAIKTKPASEHYKPADLKKRPHHMPTLIDYSAMAGSNYTEKETANMKTSLGADNWQVILNSSARTVENKQFSYTKEWHTKYVKLLSDLTTDNTDKDPAKELGYTILGIRVKYPEAPFNAWAMVKPPFEIPAYEDIVSEFTGQAWDPVADAQKISAEKGKGNKFLNGNGVVRNVAQLKSMTLRVYGCQFKNAIAIVLKDDNNTVTEYMMPEYLDFDGWKAITWNNPNYIDKAENRDLYIVPLYPRNEPFLKLLGFRFYRQGDQLGGDFVTYIRDVKITYDEAILKRDTEVIDHEDAWGILNDRNEAAKMREYSKIGNQEILRFLERQKMHTTAN